VQYREAGKCGAWRVQKEFGLHTLFFLILLMPMDFKSLQKHNILQKSFSSLFSSIFKDDIVLIIPNRPRDRKMALFLSNSILTFKNIYFSF
jgi:hypothetical protein